MEQDQIKRLRAQRDTYKNLVGLTVGFGLYSWGTVLLPTHLTSSQGWGLVLFGVGIFMLGSVVRPFSRALRDV